MPPTILAPRGFLSGSREVVTRGPAIGLSQSHDQSTIADSGHCLESVLPLAIWNLHRGDIDLALHVQRLNGIAVLGIPSYMESTDEATGGTGWLNRWACWSRRDDGGREAG